MSTDETESDFGYTGDDYTGSDPSDSDEAFSSSNSEASSDEARGDDESKRASTFKSTFSEMEFKTAEDAEKFYEGFAKLCGFAIMSKHGLCDSGFEIMRQKWTCTGSDKKFVKKRPRPDTKCNCASFMMASFDKQTRFWIITDFHDLHNHTLTPVSQISQDIYLSLNDIEAAQHLRSMGVGVEHIFMYFVALKGGMKNVQFTSQDLYNRLVSLLQSRRSRVNKDAAQIRGYLLATQFKDRDLYFRWDNEHSQSHFMWADGQSRANYYCFGDILFIDATHITTNYGQRLVIFYGLSNYRITLPFGFGLLRDQTTQTYIWLLNTFLEATLGREPVSVVTGVDQCMTSAIATVFPSAKHRLCIPRITENAPECLQSKGFWDDFWKSMHANISVDQFELEWQRICLVHNLKEDQCASALYSKRHMWAAAYLRGYFLGDVWTNERVEGMNARFNLEINGEMDLLELIRYLYSLVHKANDLQAEAECNNMTEKRSVSSAQCELYQHAVSMFTPQSMTTISEQLRLSIGLYVHSRTDWGRSVEYTVREPVSEGNVYWRVVYTRDSAIADLECQCQYFETAGFPCSHIFKVMRIEGIIRLPLGLVKKRWTKFAAHIPFGEVPRNPEARFFSLMNFLRPSWYKAKHDENFCRSLMTTFKGILHG